MRNRVLGKSQPQSKVWLFSMRLFKPIKSFKYIFFAYLIVNVLCSMLSCLYQVEMWNYAFCCNWFSTFLSLPRRSFAAFRRYKKMNYSLFQYLSFAHRLKCFKNVHGVNGSKCSIMRYLREVSFHEMPFHIRHFTKCHFKLSYKTLVPY